MTPPTTSTKSLPVRPKLPWGVAIASFGVCVLTYALCSLKAYVINDDLPNACSDLRRQSFPPEVACASPSMGGAMTGANAGWLEALFFASLVVSVMFASMALALVVAARER